MDNITQDDLPDEYQGLSDEDEFDGPEAAVCEFAHRIRVGDVSVELWMADEYEIRFRHISGGECRGDTIRICDREWPELLQQVYTSIIPQTSAYRKSVFIMVDEIINILIYTQHGYTLDQALHDVGRRAHDN